MLIMGVVNLTPDSFSDGGQFSSEKMGLEQCYRLLKDGADIVDIGAESSRPGAEPVDAQEEWRRLKPIIESLCKENLGDKISVDTYKPEIMLRCVDQGVGMVNNIQGVADQPTLTRLKAYSGTKYVCMHMHKNPKTMQTQPLAGDAAVKAVEDFFATAKTCFHTAGFSDEAIYMDPGIGFGKDLLGNLVLLGASHKLSRQYNLCVGLSRKSFIGKLTGFSDPKDRDAASKLLEMMQFSLGVKMIRTHDVLNLRKRLEAKN